MFGLAVNELLVISMLVGFIALLFLGVPVVWSLAGTSLVIAILALGLNEYLGSDTYFLDSWRDYAVIVQRIWAIMENAVLVALPLFIFMGLMLDQSGLAETLMKEFANTLGRFNGGLAVAVILIGILLAASTGIVGASVVLLTTIAMPIMLEQGYDKRLAAGVIASAGTLGILIPPSIMLIIMADQLALSVGELFMGALVPGILLGLAYLVYVVVIVTLNPALAPRPRNLAPLTAGSLLRTVLAVLPPLGLIVAVLGSIFAGIATPTEAAGIGALGASLLALANGRLSLSVLYEVSRRTTLTTAFIFGIFIGATAFALVMRALGGDEMIAAGLNAIPFGDMGVIITILAFSFIAGFFLDWLEITLIFLPLVGPVVVNDLGHDPIWFVILFSVALQTSFITPPVGFSLFYLKGAAPKEVATKDIYRGIVPFVLIQLSIVALILILPEIVTWLPQLVYD
ncbi:tripartite ATP-independent transporter DctM subunit [Defluviimonas denitrificans]|jgi:tripartite ATP-independent transporter DctM subunit|uniref:TRAP transporter large permease protein n=1 Tax=Albidovulum denitrificans TaxID=404881 RepID=A0A2S8S670_9RHOB|nr:TRAP transporter large permease subunit [Defluviimonas denitrificans]PQV56311.1 tripartite ATP-independent transporter DctM subunit [Defluviimonas denitrificans]